MLRYLIAKDGLQGGLQPGPDDPSGAIRLARSLIVAGHYCVAKMERSSPISALPELNVAKQMFVLMWIAAPILLGSTDLRAQFGRSMPRPARIVQHCARHGDHIGLATCDNLLGLTGFVTKPTAIVGRPTSRLTTSANGS